MVASADPAIPAGGPSVAILTPTAHLPLRVRPARPIDDDELLAFCRANPELRIERTAGGELIIMPPTGTRTGQRNFDLTGQFFLWVRRDGSGVGFDSSTGFILPNGAERSPDLSWVKKERWQALSHEEQEGLAPICPDFVVELRSPSDGAADVEAKLREYLACGAKLGWLIDPIERRVLVFRAGKAVEVLESPLTLGGDPELPGCLIDLASIW